MRKLILLLCVLISSQAQALWITQFSPQGNEVDLNPEAIRITFSHDIIKLGEEKKVRPEHLAHLDFGKVACDPAYQGLRTIVCKLKHPLLPG